MEEMIAYCGLVCTECPAYLATQEDDDEERRQVAQLWTKEYGHAFAPEDINCDGCGAETGRLSGYAETVCEIRSCARGRDVVSCAHCEEYGACEMLAEFLELAPGAKEKLEEIRRNH